MFGKPQEQKEKLSGPQGVPDPVKKYLVDEKKKEPGLLSNIKVVVRKRGNGEKTFDIRLFDEMEAAVKEIAVKDFTTLDTHPELIVYQGWFDQKSREVQLEEKKELKPRPEVPIFTEADILKKIEELSVPGGTIFFYLGASPAVGGPLSRGAAVIELNPSYPGKKQRKYIVYVANVDGMEPVSKRQRLFDSDKPKDVASWVHGVHHKPLYT